MNEPTLPGDGVAADQRGGQDGSSKPAHTITLEKSHQPTTPLALKKNIITTVVVKGGG